MFLGLYFIVLGVGILIGGIAGFALGVYRFYSKHIFGNLVVIKQEGEQPGMYVEMKEGTDILEKRNCVVLDVVHTRN